MLNDDGPLQRCRWLAFRQVPSRVFEFRTAWQQNGSTTREGELPGSVARLLPRCCHDAFVSPGISGRNKLVASDEAALEAALTRDDLDQLPW